MQNIFNLIISWNRKRTNFTLLLTIILSITLMLLIAFSFEGTGDTGGWRLAGKTGLYGRQYGMGDGTVYDGDCPLLCSNWPPLTYHYYILMHWLYENANPFRLNDYGFYKLLPVISSAGIILLINKLISLTKLSLNFNFLPLLYAFHPLTIYISAYHGQRESVWLFLFLTSLYFFINKRYYIFFILYALAISVKIPPILFSVFLLINLPRLKFKLLFITVIPLLLLLFNLPEIIIYPKNIFTQVFLYEGTNGWWGFAGILNKLNRVFNTQVFSQIFLPITKIFMYGSIIFFSYYSYKRKKPLFEGILGILMSVLVFNSAFASQYLLWPLPFLILLYKKYKYEFWLFTILGTYVAINSYGLFGIPFLESILKFSQENIYYKFNIPYPMDLYYPVWIVCIFILIKAVFGSYNLFIIQIYKIKLLRRLIQNIVMIYRKTLSISIKINSEYYLFVIFLILTFFFYSNSLFGYFQSDEWYYFTQFLPLTKRPDGLLLTLYKSIFSAGEVSGGGHVTPIYNSLWFIANRLFGLRYIPYIITSLTIHTINSFLVYILALRLNLNKVIAVLAGIIFTVTYVHFQAVTWIMAMFPTLFSVTFMLFSLIFLLSGKKGKKDIYISILFYIFALMTKENTIILFPVIPLLAYLYKREKFLYILKIMSGISIAYFLLRLGLPYFLSFGGSNTQSIFTIDKQLLLFRTFIYPLKVLVQVFIPAEIILILAGNMSILSYPFIEEIKNIDMTMYLTLVQGPVSDIIIYFLSGVILTFIIAALVLLRKSKQTIYLKTVFFSISIILLSALPLLGIAAYAKWWGYTTFIDSRHLYNGTIGASILLAILFNKIAYLLNKMLKEISPIFLLVFITIIWIIPQYILLQNQLINERKTALQRKSMLHYIQTVVPELNKNSIFLVTSDSHYYGFSNIIPFQTNLGQVLAVIYFQKKQLPQQFITEGLFAKAALSDNGFQKYANRGFGYFTSEKRIFDVIKTNDIAESDINAFHWDGDKQILSSKTEQFREKVKAFIKINSATKNLKSFKNSLLTFSYPKDSMVSEIADGNKEHGYVISGKFGQVYLFIKNKPKNRAFHEYVKDIEQKFSTNNLMVKNILRADGTEMTVMSTEEHRYLIPLSDSRYYIDLYTNRQLEEEKQVMNMIITTIYF